ncbi:calcium-binding protein [Streptomyces sp. ME18-1-4]|uniref:calcium-binding protein n=1 Tax=Streptomyces sp. ME18-1-4 TaxID=3028685 RepID=UPI0029B9E20F|nr:calcium-binding protein [Streptomyces sp. ME18-1-4]MDX3248117.1 calcium-binding protein [Streptomyces sp. ME18-1-4]
MGAALVLFCPGIALAAPGDLDPTFGTGGKVITNFGGTDFATSVQADGKIVAAGFTSAGGANDFALARYNTNGSLDTTFGTGGKVTTDFGGTNDGAHAVAVQPDGKIVAAGQSGSGFTLDFALARYNTDGSLDTTFGTGGKVTTSFGASFNQAFGVVLQTDGKIVAAGTTNAGAGDDFAVARYNTDGSLDTSFGTGGLVTTDFGTGSSDEASGVALQSDGKIVLAGSSDSGGTEDFALARYNTDGSLDTTFGTGGKVTTSFGGNEFADGVVVQTDGKIVAAGFTNAGGTQDFALARYNTDGSLDTTFGTGGKIVTNFGGDDVALGVALQTDGKIVAAGFTNAGGTQDFALARYNTDGSLDTCFGTGGKVITNFGGTDRADGVTVQTDGKIVAAGRSNAGGTFDFALARYLGGVAAQCLTISKSHTGNFVPGRVGTYTIIVGNIGTAATNGTTVTVHDTLAPELTATSITGRGWRCTLSTLTCTRNDVLNPGSSYPPITLRVRVARTASGTVINTATVTGGGDTSTHTATDPTTIDPNWCHHEPGHHKPGHHETQGKKR